MESLELNKTFLGISTNLKIYWFMKFAFLHFTRKKKDYILLFYFILVRNLVSFS